MYNAETAKAVTEEGQKILRQTIFRLILNGDCLTDAAETCSHDEALDDWNIVAKHAKKLIEYDKMKNEYEAEEQKYEEEKQHRKEKAYMTKRKKELLEDAEILKSFGY
jgi:hypothetical protein